MHHAMPHCGQCVTPDAFLNPIHQNAYRHRVVWRCHGPREVVLRVQAFHPQAGIGQSDPLYFAG
jgi:hypothetical protein